MLEVLNRATRSRKTQARMFLSISLYNNSEKIYYTTDDTVRVKKRSFGATCLYGHDENHQHMLY